MTVKLESQIQKAPFELRAAAALGVSVVADLLDYVASPIFATPIVGDIADMFVSTILYSLTRSKRGAVINMIEFIPVVGDLVPAYTISTLLWIRREMTSKDSVKKNKAVKLSTRLMRLTNRNNNAPSEDYF